MRTVLGIDIGGSHIAVGLVDDGMKIVSKKEHDWTAEEKADCWNSIEQYCKKYISEFIEKNHLYIEEIAINLNISKISYLIKNYQNIFISKV